MAGEGGKGPVTPAWPASNPESRPIGSLKPRIANPRTHTTEQIEQIAGLIREFGWTQPILIEPDGTIIAGHGRWLAAQTLTGQHAVENVPCIVARGWSVAQIRAYVIADNKVPANAGWNEELLRAELTALEGDDFKMELLGFSEAELDALYPEEKPEVNPDAETSAPALPGRARTRLGDVWICGAHRVMCGDARDPEAAKRLLDGQQLDCVWTDPPYNVAYEGTAGTIQNDAKPAERFAALLKRAYKSMFEVMAPGAAIYVAHADTEGLTFRREFEGAGFYLSSCLVWKKNAMVLGRSDYNWQHEPILYGWKPGAAHRWYGERNKTTLQECEGNPFEEVEPGLWLIQIGERALLVRGENLSVTSAPGSVFIENKPSRSAEHPTMKPVPLVERMILNSTKPKDRVGDLFGGSGTTLIAAHKTGRIGYVLELDPKFVDVIVGRWEKYAGQPAIRESDKVMFSRAVSDAGPTT
jgi:DNA modification methylase